MGMGHGCQDVWTAPSYSFTTLKFRWLSPSTSTVFVHLYFSKFFEVDHIFRLHPCGYKFVFFSQDKKNNTVFFSNGSQIEIIFQAITVKWVIASPGETWLFLVTWLPISVNSDLQDSKQKTGLKRCIYIYVYTYYIYIYVICPYMCVFLYVFFEVN